MKPTTTSPVITLGDDLFLIDLRRLRGGSASVLSRIPKDTPGIYAWYRTISLPNPDSASEDSFSNAIVNVAMAPHCAERKARLPPAHQVVLRPFQVVSARKQSALKSYCKSRKFRNMFAQLMDLSFLFQQPVYVGKAADLATRIAQHLAPRSPLRARLADAKIDIDTSRLLILTLDPELYEELPALSVADVADTEDEAATAGDGDMLPVELVMEEFLSRLFLPSFTLRYG